MQQRRTCSAARAPPSQAMAAVRPSGLILGATVTSCTAGASRSRGTRPRSLTQSSSIVMTASLTCGHAKCMFDNVQFAGAHILHRRKARTSLNYFTAQQQHNKSGIADQLSKPLLACCCAQCDVMTSDPATFLTSKRLQLSDGHAALIARVAQKEKQPAAVHKSNLGTPIVQPHTGFFLSARQPSAGARHCRAARSTAGPIARPSAPSSSSARTPRLRFESASRPCRAQPLL